MDWTILNCQGDFSNGLSIEFAPNLADSSCLLYIQFEEFERVEQPPLAVVVNGEKEFEVEVEAIVRYKSSSARRLY